MVLAEAEEDPIKDVVVVVAVVRDEENPMRNGSLQPQRKKMTQREKTENQDEQLLEVGKRGGR